MSVQGRTVTDLFEVDKPKDKSRSVEPNTRKGAGKYPDWDDGTYSRRIPAEFVRFVPADIPY